MQDFSPALRNRSLAALGDADRVDLAVIGGGITGVATARDAARRGLSVALFERGDFACGTSSRSSKLVHGGLRYLEHMEFGLVHEGCSERRLLLDRDPQHVEGLEFLYPVYAGDPSGYYTVKAGMLLYDALAAFQNVHRHRMLSRREFEERMPGIRGDGLKGGASYWDARMDDARYCMATARAAAREGAQLATHAEVETLERRPEALRLGVRDRFTGRRLEVNARAVVIACGPWTDMVRASLLGSRSQVLRPTKGVHIVVPRDRLPHTRSLVIRHPDDGRVLFNIPWGPATIVGTTDTDFSGDPGSAHADRADVAYILRALAHVFPEAGIGPEDVISTYTGLRPLMAEEGVDEGATSREHAILEDDRVFTIAGGKWTTHRRMAKDAVDRIVSRLELQAGPCTTGTAPVEDLGTPMVDPEDATAVADLSALEKLDPATVVRLARCYGRGMRTVLQLCREQPALARPIVEGHAPILAEARFWVTGEMALTVTDALDRRSSLALVARGQALAAARQVAAEMAGPAGWDQEETERQVEEYRRHVALSRAWADEPAG